MRRHVLRVSRWLSWRLSTLKCCKQANFNDNPQQLPPPLLLLPLLLLLLLPF